MDHAKIMAAINEALDSAEFRAVLAKCIYDRIAPAMPEENLSEAKVETILDRNAVLEPAGLAWMYRAKLSRRPYSSEDVPTLAAYFESMVKDGVPAQHILDTMVKRGRHAEGIFDFKKRVLADAPKKTSSAYAQLEAATNAELAKRAAI